MQTAEIDSTYCESIETEQAEVIVESYTDNTIRLEIAQYATGGGLDADTEITVSQAMQLIRALTAAVEQALDA